MNKLPLAQAPVITPNISAVTINGMDVNLGPAPVFKGEIADVRPEVTTGQVVDLGSVAVNELIDAASNFSYDKVADVNMMAEKSILAQKQEADRTAAMKNMSAFQEAMIAIGADEEAKKDKKDTYGLAA